MSEEFRATNLRIECCRGSSNFRITHLPTGLVAEHPRSKHLALQELERLWRAKQKQEKK